MPLPASSSGVCSQCGRRVILDRFTLCRQCRAMAKDDLDRAQEYLEDNPGASPEEIARATGANLATLKRYFQVPPSSGRRGR